MTFLDYLSDEERTDFNKLSEQLENQEATVNDLEEELEEARDDLASTSGKVRALIKLAGDRESAELARIEAGLAELAGGR